MSLSNDFLKLPRDIDNVQSVSSELMDRERDHSLSTYVLFSGKRLFLPL